MTLAWFDAAIANTEVQQAPKVPAVTIVAIVSVVILAIAFLAFVIIKNKKRKDSENFGKTVEVDTSKDKMTSEENKDKIDEKQEGDDE